MIDSTSSALSTTIEYLVLGIEHIVPKGLDHILFVIGIFFYNFTFFGFFLFWHIYLFSRFFRKMIIILILNISKKKDPMEEHEKFRNVKDKYNNHFSEKPGK